MPVILSRKAGAGGGSAAPSGPAGGDLSGTYPNPSVVGNDPIEEVLGAPDTAHEFETASLAGLTALSPTPDAENADTSVPGNYYLQDNTLTAAWCGRYIAAPAAPFTAVTKLSGSSVRNDFMGAGIFIGVGTPGAMEIMLIGGQNNRQMTSQRFTNPTTFSSTFGTVDNNFHAPLWFSIRVNAASDVDYLGSSDGYIWFYCAEGRNPAITIASVGVTMKSENSGGCGAAFDFLRVWNSAKTLPGVV